MNCWKRRNETIHGIEIDESRLKKLERIKKVVREIYRRKSELRSTRFSRVFKMPLKKRLKLGIQANTIWVGMAEETLRLHREMMTRNTIDRWIQRT